MEIKELELELKEQVLNEMLNELDEVNILDLEVDDYDLVVYDEIERLAVGRVSKDSVTYKLRKCYERELSKYDSNNKATILSKWLQNLKAV